MHALNGSGQNGTATITDVGGKVLVTVNLTGEPSGASEPAHVRFGALPEDQGRAGIQRRADTAREGFGCRSAVVGRGQFRQVRGERA